MTTTPAMPWVKLRTTYLEDIRFAALADPQKCRFFQLLMLAGKLDAGGYFIEGGHELNEAEIAWKLRLQAEQMLADLEALAGADLVCKNGRGWCIPNYEDEQGPTQADKRQAWVDRQRKHRGKNVTELSPISHTLVTSDSPVTHASVTPLEKRRGEERRGESPAPASSDLKTKTGETDCSTPGDEKALIQVSYNGYALYPESPAEAAADPIIGLFEKVTGRIPGITQYKIVIETILYVRKNKTTGLQSVVDYLKPYWLAWSTRRGQNGKLYSPSSITWLTEWAVNGSIPALDQISPNYISPEETRKRLDEADKQEHVPPPAAVLAEIKKIISRKKMR